MKKRIIAAIKKISKKPKASPKSTVTNLAVEKPIEYSAEEKFILESGCFDSEYYTERYKDVVRSKMDPLRHFCKYGWQEGRSPNLFFSTKFYVQKYPKIYKSEVNPLVHYLKEGEKKGCSPCSFFIPKYIATNLEIPKSKSILGFYLELFKKEEFHPCHPYFDPLFISQQKKFNHLKPIEAVAIYLKGGWRGALFPCEITGNLAMMSNAENFSLDSGDFEAFFEKFCLVFGPKPIPLDGTKKIFSDVYKFIESNEVIPHDLDVNVEVFILLGHNVELFHFVESYFNRKKIEASYKVFSDSSLGPDFKNSFTNVFEYEKKSFIHEIKKSLGKVVLFIDLRSKFSSENVKIDLLSDLHNLIGSRRTVYQATKFQSDYLNRHLLLPLDNKRTSTNLDLSDIFKPYFVGYLKLDEILIEKFSMKLLKVSFDEKFSLANVLLETCRENDFSANFAQSNVAFKDSESFEAKRPYFSKKQIESYFDRDSATGKNNICVFTAVLGGYDDLKNPEVVEKGVDYICFTDGPIFSHPIWQIRPVKFYDSDPTRTARFVKLNPHRMLSGYRYAVWVDANVLLRTKIQSLIDAEPGEPLLFLKHPDRDCVYVEAEFCKSRSKGNAEEIDEQVSLFRKQGIPERIGISETNFYIADLLDERSKIFFRAWWNNLKSGSVRDQVSFGFAKFTTGVSPKFLFNGNFCVRNSENFAIFRHGKNEKNGYYEDPRILSQSKIQIPSSIQKSVHAKMLTSEQNNREAMDVVICVFNAYEQVKECLSSVLDSLVSGDTLIIVNDASTDERVGSFLRKIEIDFSGKVKVFQNEVNLGYTKSANIGLKKSTAPTVVLLNSDVLVPKNWITKLNEALQSHEYVGIASPMANAASYQSLPDVSGTDGQTCINEIPNGYNLDSLNELCQRIGGSILRHPLVPIGHGFCLAIKREVFNKIGFFDEENFPMGYGEENDFCIRAGDEGFEIALATDLFLYHHKSKSFYDGEKRASYMKAGREALDRKYGSERILQAIYVLNKHPCLTQLRKDFSSNL